MRGVLSGRSRILVLARPKLGESMSLYRAALRLARLLPLGVAMALPNPSSAVRVRRCEPRVHFAVTRKGDLCVDRTRVRKSYVPSSTCLFRP